jgi:hypothetical protein
MCRKILLQYNLSIFHQVEKNVITYFLCFFRSFIGEYVYYLFFTLYIFFNFFNDFKNLKLGRLCLLRNLLENHGQ